MSPASDSPDDLCNKIGPHHDRRSGHIFMGNSTMRMPENSDFSPAMQNALNETLGQARFGCHNVGAVQKLIVAASKRRGLITSCAYTTLSVIDWT